MSLLYYPGGPNQITWAHKSREPFPAEAERNVREIWSLRGIWHWLWKWRQSCTREFRCPLEAKNDLQTKASKEMGTSMLQPPGAEFCQPSSRAQERCSTVSSKEHSSADTLIPALCEQEQKNQASHLDFQPTELWGHKFVVLSLCICGHLSWQQLWNQRSTCILFFIPFKANGISKQCGLPSPKQSYILD